MTVLSGISFLFELTTLQFSHVKCSVFTTSIIITETNLETLGREFPGVFPEVGVTQTLI